jgi:hypothetical protein
MLFQADQLAQLFHLQQFAFHHLLGQRDQRIQDAEIPFVYRNLKRLHVEPVTRQHALRIAPLRICRRAPPPRLRFIDNVVVYQRCGMNNLDYRSQSHRAPPFVVHQLRRQQKQRRTNPLPSARPQIFTNLGNRLHAGDSIVLKLLLQRDEILPQQIENFFPVNGGGRAQSSVFLRSILLSAF